jgi:predicted nucleotidyltransferase
MRTVGFLALHQDGEYGAADIAEFVGVTRPAIVQALGYLERDGLVSKRSVGKKRLYRINADHSYYPELRSIALKTLGGVETIAKEIQDDPAVRFAAVFGSFARGDEGPQSDLDVLFVIGDKDWEEVDYRLASAMAGVSQQIARTVSPNIYRESEFARLRREKNASVEQILSSPMTVLKGELSAA